MIKPKKGLGQHFLIQKEIARKIVDLFIQTLPNPNVIEVGPGKGILTAYLIEHPIDLRLIETDLDMVKILHDRFPDLSEKIWHADFLKLPITSILHNQVSIIGNFPYNISSQILFKVLDHKDQVIQIVGMFQKEVAERICALHGSKKYGILSVLIQAFYSAKFLFSVQPDAFSPPPKVISGVISLIRNDFHLEDEKERFFRIIVKAAFNQRRKMLRNSIKAWIPEGMHQEPLFTYRPEQLSVHDFIELASELYSKP